MDARYRVVLTPDPDGGYVVTVPAMPGLTSYGETVEEAIVMAHDAMEGWLAVQIQYGDPVPASDAEDGVQNVSLTVQLPEVDTIPA